MDTNYNPYFFNQGSMQQVPMQQALLDQRNPETEYYKEVSLMHERAHIDVQKYAYKRTMDEESIVCMMMAKADIQTKRDMLAEEIIITDDGRLRRKQEFMLEDSKEFYLANFSILDKPIKFITLDINCGVLYLHATIEGRGEQNLFFDLDRDDSGYYRKKFRNMGIIFKKKRKDGNEFFFDVIQAIIEMSQTIELPKNHGFYMSNGILQYADKEAMLWKEVIEYAK